MDGFRLWILAVLSVGLLGAGAPVSGADDFFGGRGSGSGFGAALGGNSEDQLIEISAQFTAPSGARPGQLFITAKLKNGWYTYSITQPPPGPEGGPVITEIIVPTSREFQLRGAFQADPPPEATVAAEFGNLRVEKHHGVVTWYAPIELAPGVDPAKVRIHGSVKTQLCSTGSCMPPKSYAFAAGLGSGVNVAQNPPQPKDTNVSPRPPAPSPKTTSAGNPYVGEPVSDRMLWQPFTTIAALAEWTGGNFDRDQIRVNLRAQVAGASVWVVLWYLAAGFLGGLILNIMPCVLPVIGLKILSFVEQSGHDRKTAFLLNVWYSLGLLAVFFLLATLAVIAGFGWGQFFTYEGFSMTLAAVVFVMALSFLGVWELPIPGFAGRGTVSELAAKEGASGAFIKGVLTTVLATPCSAPFLAPALTWAAAQPAILTYAVLLAAGLGMASPYLLLGAFPQLLRFLPKPGAWMDTFKQAMGFVLLGTVVFILSYVKPPHVVPMVGLLFAAWGACWWIGRLSVLADSGTKARAWAGAIGFVGVVWILMFPGLGVILPERYAPASVAEAMQERFERRVALEAATRPAVSIAPSAKGGSKIVVVDFTADWCVNCKTVEAGVLNTPAIRDAVRRNGIVTLRADWTSETPEVGAMLDMLGSKQIPVLAVFPAGRPNQPIVLRGLYTQSQLLTALQEAGASL